MANSKNGAALIRRVFCALPAACLLAIGPAASATAVAQASWGVTYSFDVGPGLVATYNEVSALGGIHLTARGTGANMVDTFVGGASGMVEFDAASTADPPSGFASVGIYGPLGDMHGIQPLAYFSNPTGAAVDLTVHFSSFTMMSVHGPDFAAAAVSYRLLAGSLGAPSLLDQWSDSCDTRLGCSGDIWTHGGSPGIPASIDPGGSYALWIEDAKVQTLAGVAPEPGTWAMMIVGFGLAGVATRRSRRALTPT
jgi:hypothetical protein